MTIAAIRAGIAEALDTIDGLRVSAYMVDSVAPPMAVVIRRRVEYGVVQEAQPYDGVFAVRVYAQRIAEKAAQQFLDALVEPTGSGSVKAALESDPTLGGVVDSVEVLSADEVALAVVGDVEYLAIDFELRVLV